MVLNIHWDSYKISVVRKMIKVVHSRKFSDENKMQKKTLNILFWKTPRYFIKG